MSVQSIAIQSIKKFKLSGMVKTGENPFFVLFEYIIVLVWALRQR